MNKQLLQPSSSSSSPSSSSNVCKTSAVLLLSFLVLKYKIVAFVAVLVASAIVVALPVLGKKIPAIRPEKDIFFVIKAFAAGVIFETAFIHVLPDTFESLPSPCLNENPCTNFPFTGFIAMMAAVFTLMVNTLATGYYRRSNFKKTQGAIIDKNDDQDLEQLPEHVDHPAPLAQLLGPEPPISLESLTAMESLPEDNSSPHELPRHHIIPHENIHKKVNRKRQRELNNSKANNEEHGCKHKEVKDSISKITRLNPPSPHLLVH